MRGAAFALSPRSPKPCGNFARACDGTSLAVMAEGRVTAANAHRPRSAGASIADDLDTLLAMARFAREDGASPELIPLDPMTAAAGYAARRTRPNGDAPGSGLAVDAGLVRGR